MPDHGDPNGPTAAGVWHYWLGGKDVWPVEIAAGDAVAAEYPRINAYAANSRSWLVRAVRHAAEHLGLDQFLDVGAGLPAAYNTHEIATAHQPGARTLYLDIDPRVVLHQGVAGDADNVHCEQADMRDTEAVLAAAGQHLDLSRPVAVIFSDCLGHLDDWDTALATVQNLCSRLPAGSHLLLSHSTSSSDSQYDRVRYTARSPEIIRRFFDGLELIEPGLVSVQEWHPDADTPAAPDLYEATYAGVARIA